MKFYINRRQFLRSATLLTGAVATSSFTKESSLFFPSNDVKVSGHLWIYASKYPAPYDCSPVLEQVFADIKVAGLAGIELMKPNLQHDDAVSRISALIDKYDLPVTGCSFGADMWNPDNHASILESADIVTDRLSKLGGEVVGISVGNAKRLKTEQDFDAQANLLRKILPLCESKGLKPNLHNHTYEVENNLHDLKGTLARIPDVKLGPDINWLVRAGVDPVWFFDTYGKQIVYMHLRDQKANGKWTEAVGEGITDFEGIAKSLKKSGFQGSAAVELAFDDPTTRPFPETWKISRKYVKKTFGW